jgi:hypothetical protein
MSLGSAVVRKAGAQMFLPTENEWYKAAYYKGGGTNAGYWIYPTSSDGEPGRDMTEVTNPGNNVNRFRIVPEDPFPIDPPAFQTVAGEFELSASPYGTFDQGGNLWEWTEIWIPASSTRLLRGGSFANEALTLKAGYRAFDFPPELEHQYHGFRVGEVVAGCDPCDMNCDGDINAFDIEPFLELLFGPDPTPCDPGGCTGDVNGDGVVNAFDIEPFLECLFP